MISKYGEWLVKTEFKECECPDIISVSCDYCGCKGSIVKEYDKNQNLKNEINSCDYGKGAYFLKDESYKEKVIFNEPPSIRQFEDFLYTIKHIKAQYYRECYFNIWDEKEHRLINIFKELKPNEKVLLDVLEGARDYFKKLT